MKPIWGSLFLANWYTILLHPAQVWPVTVRQDALGKLPPSSRHHSEWPETFFCLSSWLHLKPRSDPMPTRAQLLGGGLCLPYLPERLADLEITPFHGISRPQSYAFQVQRLDVDRVARSCRSILRSPLGGPGRPNQGPYPKGSRFSR